MPSPEPIARAAEPRAPDAVLDVITERERDVLALVAKDLSNAEIAARMLTKLDARDRAQLIVIADESHLVRPGASLTMGTGCGSAWIRVART